MTDHMMDIDGGLILLGEACELALGEVFARAEKTALVTQARVLDAFREARVSAAHMNPSTGYGYGDLSRDTLGRVFAGALQTEDALVRPQFASGTHAIAVMLYAILKPGDTLLFACGEPYDTLRGVVGMGENPARGSLRALGVEYAVTKTDARGHIDFPALEGDMRRLKPAVVYIQRSRGYAWRDAVTLSEIKRVAELTRSVLPGARVAADNCYGEFTCEDEPSRFGVDVMAGSLIKNPGGGIAPTGGYIAGRRDLIELAGERLTVPGMGREVGSYAAPYTPFYQGIFLAPHVVGQSKKTAALAALMFERLGFETLPRAFALRNDIVEAVRFGTERQLVAFCRGVQMGAPVDSFAVTEPWDMPGYDDKVVMASGSFVQGSSIEWSADGPIRPPYTAYLQGGLTYEHGKLALLKALDVMLRENLIALPEL